MRAKLTDQDADIQWATLVSALPYGGIEALETLPYAAQSDRTDVDKVLKLLEAEHLEEINEIYESYVFFTRQQEEGEPITSYIAELKRLAGTCNFGNLSDRLIRDRIFCGVADPFSRKSLLSQAKLDLPGCTLFENEKERERGSNLRRQRLASPAARVIVAQTTRPVQKNRLRDEL